MNTIKTAVIIVLLMTVLYGVYMVINKKDSLSSWLDNADTEETSGGELEMQVESGTLFNPGDAQYKFDPPNDNKKTTIPHFQGGSQHDDDPYGQPSSDFRSSQVQQASASSNVRNNQIDRAPSASKSYEVTPVAPFVPAWKKAVQQIKDEQYREALETLSAFYDNPDLTFEQQQQLLTTLDPLAAKVIYSNEHFLGNPYVVQGSETLEDVAMRYKVPAKLLQNINAVTNPNLLTRGTRLKVVPGPFRAVVDLRDPSKSKLTLFVGRLYAGRFDVSVGEVVPSRTSYNVIDKRPGWEYHWPDNNDKIPAGHPTNPYGQWWIALGGDVSIHGSPVVNAAGTIGRGCISLRPQDAADVYGILSRGSEVEIRR